MPEPTQTAKLKLVIIVGPFELSDQLAADIKRVGASGFTRMRVDGSGAHGPRTYGMVDGANVRIEIVATAALAAKILGHVATTFEGRAVLAYSLDIEAVPVGHFA